MKTSQEWWSIVKNDNVLLNNWLLKQYRGEVTASHRIMNFANKYCKDQETLTSLETIADQERLHALWVLELLKIRGIIPSIDNAEEKYWKETLPEIQSFETGVAIGAHAEAMRLERIKVIADDTEAPQDIRRAFKRILKDEIIHEATFRKLAGEEAMNLTKDAHEKGMELLGLIA